MFQKSTNEDGIHHPSVGERHKTLAMTMSNFHDRKYENQIRRLDDARYVEVRSFARGREAFSQFFSSEANPRDREAHVKKHAQKCIADGSVSLRPGWERLLDLATKGDNNVGLGILSVNWSPVWIKACIAAAWARMQRGHDGDGSNGGGGPDASLLYKGDNVMPAGSQERWPWYDHDGCYDLVNRMLDVRCNDVFSCAPSDTTSPEIFTASDKLREMRAMITTWRKSQISQRVFRDAIESEEIKVKERLPRAQMSIEDKGRIIYVGDSPTDLLCLLATNTAIGVCIRESSPPSPVRLSETEKGKYTRRKMGETEQDQLYRLLVEELGVDVVRIGESSSAFPLSSCNGRTQDREVSNKEKAREKIDGERTKKVFWARDFEEVLASDILG